MNTHQTKHNIGDKVFVVEQRDGYFDIVETVIRRIVIGGKAWERYQTDRSRNYGDGEVFTDFEEAREYALKEHALFADETREKIKDQKAPYTL
jgi:hypothetical protein